MENKKPDGLKGLTLCQLTLEDLDAVMELQELVFQGLPDSRWYVTSTAEEYRETLSRGEVFGCRDWQKLVAFAVLTPWRARGERAYAPKIQHEVEDTFDFQDVMVNPAYRRRGIHSAFLRLFEETARIMGAKAIYATIDPDNHPSVTSFEKAGYAHIKTQPAYDGRPRGYFCKRLSCG